LPVPDLLPLQWFHQCTWECPRREGGVREGE
jgi:hypothetical protein